MKPVHVVLLVAGAGIMGALAVKMTQPVPIPPSTASSSNSSSSAPAAIRPAPSAIPQPKPVPEAPAAAPPPVFIEPLVRKNKPNPFPAPVSIAVPAPLAKLPSPPAYVPPAPPPQPVPEARPPRRQVTLQSGMIIAVRLSQSLAGCAKSGETFSGSLAQPLVVDKLVIAERGARINGRCSGNSPVELQLLRVVTSDGQLVSVSTETRTSEAPVNGPISFRLTSPVTVTEREIN